MERFITISSASIFIAVVACGDFLYKRLDRPGYVKMTRIICWLVSITSLPFIIVTVLRSSRLLDSFLYQASISNRVLFSMAVSWLVVVFMLTGFLKYWLYYIKHDEKTILMGWHMREHFSLLKERKYDEAYQYLQKASEISPDSICIWCTLALFSEQFLKSLDQADQYLAKAKQVLDSSASPSLKDQAVFEHYTGTILQYRCRLQEGLEHMKRAYELDPTPYRKKEYESALKKTQEAQDKTDS